MRLDLPLQLGAAGGGELLAVVQAIGATLDPQDDGGGDDRPGKWPPARFVHTRHQMRVMQAFMGKVRHEDENPAARPSGHAHRPDPARFAAQREHSAVPDL